MSFITNLHPDITSVLEGWQITYIMEKIPNPRVSIDPSDPVWERLDPLLNADNNLMNMDVTWLEVSIHTIFPETYAAFLKEQSGYPNREAIIINAQDLESIRNGGIQRLALDHLLGDF